MEKIKKAGPKKLYISSDFWESGKDESKNIDVCSEIIESIDWDCNVKTFFQTQSIGYQNSVFQAIVWFFENETEGIVLESFYIPSDDFFGFCSQLLEKYRDDVRIGHIAGTGFSKRDKKNNDSYYFSVLSNIQGWASWSRVWKNFNKQLKLYPSFKRAKVLDNSSIFSPFKIQWKHQFEWAILNRKTEFWRIMHQYVLIAGNYLSIVPDTDLTHYAYIKTKDTGISVFNDKLTHPLFIVADAISDLKYQESYFSIPVITTNKPDGYSFIEKKLLSFTRTSAVNERMKIPRIIHQIYEDPEGPPEFLLSLAETWKKLHPEWEYRFWNRKAIYDFMELTCPGFIPYYQSYPFNVQRWDAIRYLILYHIGGIYVDLDYECLQSLDTLLMDSTCCMGMEPAINSIIHLRPMIIGNALMAAVPKHPYMAAVIEDMKANISIDYRQGDSIQIMETTGPFMVTRVYEQFKKKRDITLLSGDLVAPLTMNEVQMLRTGKVTKKLEEKVEKAFAIHYFFGSWTSQTNEDRAL
ncbi:MAG: hypothetical protein FWD60_11310 [Candidatus Azobacteroides sp.]|nr:hypothetical protein [Candidatus Azobacteroides sp.]